MGVTIDRLSGWSNVMNEHGLDTGLIAYADFKVAGGEQATRIRLTVIVCARKDARRDTSRDASGIGRRGTLQE